MFLDPVELFSSNLGAVTSNQELGKVMRIFLIIAFSILSICGANAVTFNVSGSDLLGDTISGTIEGDPTLSTITSINLVDADGPLTRISNYQASNGMLIGVSPTTLVPIFLSFAGGPTLMAANDNAFAYYQSLVTASFSTFNPAVCGTDVGCQASVQRLRDGSLAQDAAIFNSTFIASASSQVATTPLPAALPMFASALAGAGFFRWFRRRKQKATAAA
jgi:hypothetical protein